MTMPLAEETPQEHIRNAMQVLKGGTRDDMDWVVYSPRELEQIQERLTTALQQLERSSHA